MGGRLEHEIRLLPHVLSCSFSNDDYVVVLIDPSADPRTIQLAVERILQNAGSEATVRVVGPPDTAAAATTRTISPLVATATIASVAAIGISALVGGLVAVEKPRVETQRKPAAPTAAAAPFDTLDTLRGLGITVQQGGSPPEQLVVPVEAPDHMRQALPVHFSSFAEAVSLTKAMPRVRPVHPRVPETEETLVRASNRRDALRARHGRHLGSGPRPWSQSVLLPPHPHKERGQDR